MAPWLPNQKPRERARSFLEVILDLFYTHTLAFPNVVHGAIKMAEQTKVLAANLSLIFRTHVVGGENKLLQVVL